LSIDISYAVTVFSLKVATFITNIGDDWSNSEELTTVFFSNFEMAVTNIKYDQLIKAYRTIALAM